MTKPESRPETAAAGSAERVGPDHTPSAPEHTGGLTYAAEDVHKTFSRVSVLKGVSVSFRPGEIHTLVGENGAGKSTLLKVMSGVYPLDGGAVSLDGVTLGALTPSAARHKGIYLVPQEPRLMPDLSVAENLYLGALPKGKLGVNIDWRRMNTAAGAVLDRVGLDVNPRSLAGRLPLAHQQLLECARALAHDCGVIFFDEPTSPLTSHEADKLFALMDDLRSQGLTLGFISHRFEEVEQVSDRITVLRDGVVTARFARGDASRADLVNAMVGRKLTMTKRAVRAPKTSTPVLTVQNVSSEPEVRGMSLEVRPGEIIGLGGLVGSGRTELSEALFGLRPLTSGTVTVNGRDITGFTPRKCIDAGLVYLAEDRGRTGIFADVDLVRNASAAIISRLPRRGALIRRQQERAEAHTALQDSGVRAATMDMPIKSLSGGNQQKVMLARWVLANPAVAIFDEPTRGVDVGAKEGIYQTIERLADGGLATVVISSELEELVRLCDRVYGVYEGRIVGELVGDAISSAAIGNLAVGAAA